MNNIITSLHFQTHELRVCPHEGKPWLSLPDIERALGYSGRGNSLGNVYKRHADEFTNSMTALREVATTGGRQLVRFFSLRGAHLMAMFSRTPAAKEFRRWVLDILDEEVREKPSSGRRITPEIKERLEHLCHEVAHIRSWWDYWAPAFREINGRGIAAPVHDHMIMATAFTTGLVIDLNLADPFPLSRRALWGR